MARVLVGITSGASGIAILAALVTVGYLYNDINNFFDDTMKDMEEFKIIANDAWTKMISTNYVGGRSPRQECPGPPGPDGPEGPAGPDGNEGAPGEAGEDEQSLVIRMDQKEMLEKWVILDLLENQDRKALAGNPGADGEPGAPGIDGEAGAEGLQEIRGWDGGNGRGPWSTENCLDVQEKTRNTVLAQIGQL
ncbi:nematode cuticle collagen domain protein [Ostertagia ostertagi]